jgi:hypothetical protein
VDSVQRDRSRLQDECNSLEAELQSSQDEILTLKLLLSQQAMSVGVSSSSSASSFSQSQSCLPLVLPLDESKEEKAMAGEPAHPPTASVSDSSAESSLDESGSSEQRAFTDQDQAAETPSVAPPQGIGHTESPLSEEAQHLHDLGQGHVDGSTPEDESHSQEDTHTQSPTIFSATETVACASPPPLPPVVLTSPGKYENLPPVPPSPLPRSLPSPGSPRSPKKIVHSTPVSSQAATPLASRPYTPRSLSIASQSEAYELISSHTAGPLPAANQLMKELTHELMQTKEEVSLSPLPPPRSY